MELPPKEIHVWYCDINQTLDSGSYLGLLSENELDRLKKYRFPLDRKMYGTARYVLKTLLGDYLNIRPPEITFLYGEHGKPEYVHPQNIQFNISHSQDILVLAFVKDHAIGIDIEKITKEVRVAEIAKNFFSPDEITALMSLPKGSRHKAFYRCWTRKEAFIKAKGSGLSFPLDAFTVSLDTDEDAQILKTDWNTSERLHWNLLSFKPYPGYLGAVSVNGNFESVKYLDWNALESTYRPG